MNRDTSDFDPYALYSTVPYDPSAAGSQRVPHSDNKDPHAPTKYASTSSYYPLSVLVNAFWIALIATELFLLERSVAVASKAVSQPWYYSNNGLPSFLLTIFAQGHGPITAMHLGRLAISGLQSSRMSPRTWIELFWLSDKKWAGPVGIVLTLWSSMKIRIRPSTTFILFSIISLIALTTPLVLNRAYPIRTIDVQVQRSFAPNTLTRSRLAAIDAYNQEAAGAGAWVLNQTVFELFNATTYVPSGSLRNDSNVDDLFFAGDVEGMDMDLLGIRLQGGCHTVENQGNLEDFAAFTDYCNHTLFGGTLAPGEGEVQTELLNSPSLALNISWCSNGSWSMLTSPSNTSALMWFNNTNTTGMLVGDVVKGLVRCDSYLTAGSASLSGRNLTFDGFKEDSTLLNASQAGEPMLDPLYLALEHLTTTGRSGDESIQGQLISILGYTEEGANYGLYYRSPSLNGFADAMWRGVSYMTLALAILSRSTDETYPATEHFAIAGRTRDTPLLIGALALLATWLLCMLGLTGIMWRSTSFGGSLDSYAAARLMSDRMDLVSGDCDGGLEDNKRLVESFVAVEHLSDSK